MVLLVLFNIFCCGLYREQSCLFCLATAFPGGLRASSLRLLLSWRPYHSVVGSCRHAGLPVICRDSLRRLSVPNCGIQQVLIVVGLLFESRIGIGFRIKVWI